MKSLSYVAFWLIVTLVLESSLKEHNDAYFSPFALALNHFKSWSPSSLSHFVLWKNTTTPVIPNWVALRLIIAVIEVRCFWWHFYWSFKSSTTNFSNQSRQERDSLESISSKISSWHRKNNDGAQSGSVLTLHNAKTKPPNAKTKPPNAKTKCNRKVCPRLQNHFKIWRIDARIQSSRIKDFITCISL